MDDKQTHLEKWAMELQASNDRSREAFETWMLSFGKGDLGWLVKRMPDGRYAWEGSEERWAAWQESRRQTLLEFAPRILIASDVAALIHKLDALQPKQS